MSRRMWARGLVGLCSLVVCGAIASAQEKKPAEEPKKVEPQKKTEEAKKTETGQGQPGTDAAMAEMMKKMTEFATPGEAHKRLDPLVGKWQYSVRWWMGPDAAAQTSKGLCENRWLLGGRYLHQMVVGTPSDPDQPALQGFGVLGYDNLRKQYFGMWIDNMGTGIMLGYGTADPTGKVITMNGEASDPTTGETNRKWRSVTRIESDDQHVYEMYGPGPDGKEYKQLEITYTRMK
jgi:hypothetical protein